MATTKKKAEKQTADDVFAQLAKRYQWRVGRGIYSMFSREGDAAVAAAVRSVRKAMKDGVVATPDDVRQALRARMERVGKRFAEAFDSEVWIHLVHEFKDVIPPGLVWPRGWLEYGDNAETWVQRMLKELKWDAPRLARALSLPETSDEAALWCGLETFWKGHGLCSAGEIVYHLMCIDALPSLLPPEDLR